MRKTSNFSRQIIKAITVGLSASMLLQPISVFAEGEPDTDGSQDGENTGFTETTDNQAIDPSAETNLKAAIEEADQVVHDNIEGKDDEAGIETFINSIEESTDYKNSTDFTDEQETAITEAISDANTILDGKTDVYTNVTENEENKAVFTTTEKNANENDADTFIEEAKADAGKLIIDASDILLKDGELNGENGAVSSLNNTKEELDDQTDTDVAYFGGTKSDGETVVTYENSGVKTDIEEIKDTAEENIGQIVTDTNQLLKDEADILVDEKISKELSDITEYNKSVETARTAISKANEAYAAARALAAEINAQSSISAADVARVQALIDAAKEAEGTANKAVEDLNKLAKPGDALETADQVIEDFVKNNKTVSDAINAATVIEANAELENAQSQEREAGEGVLRAAEEVDTLEAKITKLRAKYENLVNSTVTAAEKAIDAEIQSAKEELEGLETERGKAITRLTNAQTTYENAQKAAKEAEEAYVGALDQYNKDLALYNKNVEGAITKLEKLGEDVTALDNNFSAALQNIMDDVDYTKIGEAKDKLNRFFEIVDNYYIGKVVDDEATLSREAKIVKIGEEEISYYEIIKDGKVVERITLVTDGDDVVIRPLEIKTKETRNGNASEDAIVEGGDLMDPSKGGSKEYVKKIGENTNYTIFDKETEETESNTTVKVEEDSNKEDDKKTVEISENQQTSYFFDENTNKLYKQVKADVTTTTYTGTKLNAGGAVTSEIITEEEQNKRKRENEENFREALLALFPEAEDGVVATIKIGDNEYDYSTIKNYANEDLADLGYSLIDNSIYDETLEISGEFYKRRYGLYTENTQLVNYESHKNRISNQVTKGTDIYHRALYNNYVFDTDGVVVERTNEYYCEKGGSTVLDEPYNIEIVDNNSIQNRVVYSENMIFGKYETADKHDSTLFVDKGNLYRVNPEGTSKAKKGNKQTNCDLLGKVFEYSNNTIPQSGDANNNYYYEPVVDKAVVNLKDSGLNETQLNNVREDAADGELTRSEVSNMLEGGKNAAKENTKGDVTERYYYEFAESIKPQSSVSVTYNKGRLSYSYAAVEYVEIKKAVKEIAAVISETECASTLSKTASWDELADASFTETEEFKDRVNEVVKLKEIVEEIEEYDGKIKTATKALKDLKSAELQAKSYEKKYAGEYLQLNGEIGSISDQISAARGDLEALKAKKNDLVAKKEAALGTIDTFIASLVVTDGLEEKDKVDKTVDVPTVTNVGGSDVVVDPTDGPSNPDNPTNPGDENNNNPVNTNDNGGTTPAGDNTPGNETTPGTNNQPENNQPENNTPGGQLPGGAEPQGNNQNPAGNPGEQGGTTGQGTGGQGGTTGQGGQGGQGAGQGGTENTNPGQPEAQIGDEPAAQAAEPQMTSTINGEDVPKAAGITGTIEGEGVPLANLPEAQKMNWWWLLLVLILGTSGAEMYRRKLVKKNAEKKED